MPEMNATAASAAQSGGSSKRLRELAEFLVVAVCMLAFGGSCLLIIGSQLGHNTAGLRDYVEYWASGDLLMHRANPYDHDAILRLESSAGFPAGIPPLVMPNPPWILPLVFPFGLLSPKVGFLLWVLLLLAALVASVQMIWIMHGRPRALLNFLGYSFAPALSCLLLGQMSIFLLFGLVLFLRLHRSRPFWAGASLYLCMLKPHLFLPFGFVLLVWVITTKGYKLLAGAIAALGLSTAIALLLDPHAWAHYGRMLAVEHVDRTLIPCLGIMLRRYVWPHTFWLQCVPAALGCAWALWYFRRHRDNWDWLSHGSLLILVSALVPPYTWFMDQAIVIPALLYGAYITRSRSLIGVLALASAVIDLQSFMGVTLQSILYLWPSLAWLAWYLCATSAGNRIALHQPPSLADGVFLLAEKG